MRGSLASVKKVLGGPMQFEAKLRCPVKCAPQLDERGWRLGVAVLGKLAHAHAVKIVPRTADAASEDRNASTCAI